MITYLRCQNCKAGYEYAGPKLMGNPLIWCPRCERKVRANIFKVLHRGDIQFAPLLPEERPPVPVPDFIPMTKSQEEAGGFARPRIPRNYLLMPKMKEEDKEAFWGHVRATGPDECWKWKKPFNSAGYGRFALRGRKYIAARTAYFLVYGVDPGQTPVRHTCQNNACINPAHLFLSEAPLPSGRV